MNKTNNEIKITFRIYEREDILRFEKWKKELASNGETLSNAMLNLLRNHLLEKEKKIVLNTLREDIFYSFRKSLFASLAPFASNIIREINKARIEEVIINKKLDLVINNFLQNPDEYINNLNHNLLAEPKYFDKTRELFIVDYNNKLEKVNKKIADVKDQQKKFKDYQKRNSDWDTQIISQVYDNFEQEPEVDVNLDELDFLKEKHSE
ncbi:integrative conjugal element protein [Mycoplasma capricolum subsp. capricolum]|uniref:Mbov_0398 family ICE element protein n=1 Tax=Mycoplasma capricolum TaxID=2095 RepID=UPI003DA5E371